MLQLWLALVISYIKWKNLRELKFLNPKTCEISSTNISEWSIRAEARVFENI